MPRRLTCNVLRVGSLAMVAAMAIWLVWPALAQEKAGIKEDAKAVAAKKAKKPSGRVPMYFAEVVDKTQRATILAIMEEYRAKIDVLKSQLDAVTKERDERVAAVLTPEQAMKIEALKAAARAKRRLPAKEAKAAEPARKQAPASR